MMAASQKQARVLWTYLCRWLDDGVTFKSGKATNNLCVHNPATETGAWEVAGGEMMQDAIETSMGKLGSSLRVLYIGTRAPAKHGWWIDLLDGGTQGRTFVCNIQGDRKRWDDWQHIREINPLMCSHAEGREVLRDKARKDTRLKARFLSYRLNIPSSDESVALLTVDEWDMLASRPVPPREGRPIIGVDLGYNRAWSAGTAVYPNGRIEVVAMTAGIPSIAEQEERDGVPGNTYQDLVDRRLLVPDPGRHVVRVDEFGALLAEHWPDATGIIADRVRAGELLDAAHVPVEHRRARWAEAAYDIRALRKQVADGPLAIAEEYRPLFFHSSRRPSPAHEERTWESRQQTQ